MRFYFLVCLLFVALMSGQTAPPTPAPAPAASTTQTAPAAPNAAQNPAAALAQAAAAAKAPEAPAPPPEVKPDDPVVTIKNFCPDTNLEGDACKTVVTKAQFEKLADALQPGMPPAVRRQLATAYARLLAMSSAAEKRGLDKQPAFDEAVRFARMNVLSQQLSRTLQAEANNVSDADIQDYYQKNQSNYEQATFVRLFVPHTKRVPPPPPAPTKKPASSPKAQSTAPKKPASAPAINKAKDPVASSSDQEATTEPKKAAPGGGAKTATTTTKKAGAGESSAKAAAAKAKAPAKTLSPEEQEKAGEEAMTKEAALLRERLIKGEDPEKLEKAAWEAAGLPGNPSPAKMEKVRRTSLPAGHQSVMDLKEGEVSEVISDNTGNYVYKLLHKETLPLDNVKTEIKNQVSSQRFREQMQHFQTPPDLNDAYFGPSRPQGMPMPPRGPKPPAKKEEEDRD